MNAMPTDLAGSYPDEMIERFTRVVAALPVGTRVNYMGMIPAVVTGHQMLPVREQLLVPHLSTPRRNADGRYFVLHMNRLDGAEVFNGTVMTFAEAEGLAKDEILRTPEEWSILDDIVVGDPDGWRFEAQLSDGTDLLPKEWDVPIPRWEWDYRKALSTCARRKR